MPRALQGKTDTRIVIPGYRSVLKKLGAMQVVGTCAPHAGLPACAVARSKTADGTTLYVVLSPELFEREGGPYTDDNGRPNLSLRGSTQVYSDTQLSMWVRHATGGMAKLYAEPLAELLNTAPERGM